MLHNIDAASHAACRFSPLLLIAPLLRCRHYAASIRIDISWLHYSPHCHTGFMLLLPLYISAITVTTPYTLVSHMLTLRHCHDEKAFAIS